MTTIESFKLLLSLLCDPDGQVSIQGTDEDRTIIRECLDNIETSLMRSK